MYSIKINMQILETKPYKSKCLIVIRDEWKTIKELEEYIKEIYKLKKIKLADIDNCYIPSSEPIDLIKRNHITELKAIYAKSLRSDNDDESVIQTQTKPMKSSLNETSMNSDYPISTNNEIVQRKKRKRQHTKKDAKELHVSSIKPVLQAVITPAKKVLNCHMKFDDEGNAKNASEEDFTDTKNRPIYFNNIMESLKDSLPRKLKPTVIDNSVLLRKNPEPTFQERVIKEIENKPNKLTIIEDKIISNGFELLKNSSCNEEMTISRDFAEKEKISTVELQVRTMLPLAKPLQGELQIQDILLFKINRLNENYEPTLSDYICGTLVDILGENEEYYLNIFINDGQDQIKEPLGKFSLDFEENNDSQYLKVKQNELHDLRVYVI